MNGHTLSRRRFLSIAAAAPMAGLSRRALAAAPSAKWRGVALGASSQIVLSGLDQDEAAPIFTTIREEISRLEDVFSLYRTRSELTRLNDAGRVANPSGEMLEVLSLSRAVWRASLGAFDPSVQPLWRDRAHGRGEPEANGDFGDVRFAGDAVELRPGMALTLNGIAQGYATDRIAALLRARGLVDLVVDTGEQRALGVRPDGAPWRIGLSEPGGDVLARLSLSDRALATSSPGGSRLADGGGRIIDGRTGVSAARWSIVSVTHGGAAAADALSTAACCLDRDEGASMLAHFDDARFVFRA